MKREEIAAVQKLELDALAENEVAETRREAKQARDRIDAAAAAIAARLGKPVQAGERVEPVLPAELAANETVAAQTEPVHESPVLPLQSKVPKTEAPDFADIAANIAGNDWKDL